jgi:hypothetical protein
VIVVQHQRLIAIELGVVQVLELVRVEQVYSVPSQRGKDLLGALRGAMVPVVAEEEHTESLGLWPLASGLWTHKASQ